MTAIYAQNDEVSVGEQFSWLFSEIELSMVLPEIRYYNPAGAPAEAGAKKFRDSVFSRSTGALVSTGSPVGTGPCTITIGF